jgi:hypothetical protein
MQNFELNSPPLEVYAQDPELEKVSIATYNDSLAKAYERFGDKMREFVSKTSVNYNFYQKTNLQTSYD